MGATLRASRTAGIAGAALIAAAAVWTAVPGTTTVPSAAQADDGNLVDRFLDVVEAVPEMDPDNILVGEFDREVAILGDLVGDHRQLEAVHDGAQSLFIDGDEARTPLGDTLAEGARSVMLIEDGYRRLADFELVVPFTSVDDLEVAVGTDEPRHLLQQGVDLLQQGHRRLEDVLVALRDEEMTTEQTTRYRTVVEQAVRHSVSVDPALRNLARDNVSLQVLKTDRFEADIAGTAVARWVSYICIPRDSADALSMAALVGAIENSLGVGLADDCPNLPNPEVLDPDSVGVDLTPDN